MRADDDRGRAPYLHNKGPISATNHVSEGWESGYRTGPAQPETSNMFLFPVRCKRRRTTINRWPVEHRGRKTRRCGETITGREYETSREYRKRIDEKIAESFEEEIRSKIWTNDTRMEKNRKLKLDRVWKCFVSLKNYHRKDGERWL